MNKNNRRLWTLTPYFLIFSACLLIMSILFLQFSLELFIISLSLSLVSAGVVLFYCFKFKNYVSDTVFNTVKSIREVNKNYLNKFSMPVVVVGDKGDIIWYNDKFYSQISNDNDDATGDLINHYIEGKSIKDVIKSREIDITYNSRKYTVYSNLVNDGVVLYFVDNTHYKYIEKEYKDTRPAVAMVVFDNREDFDRNYSDEQNVHIVITIENMLQKWANKYNGLYKKISSDRYLIIFSEKELQVLIEEKFKILSEIKELKLIDNKQATISIGVARGENGLKEKELDARKALEMALGRGGDQVAIKNADEYKFFGGVSKGYEKFDKVRTRVIASTLKQHIKSANNVLLMGHKNSDLDCVGAAIGLWSVISKACNTPAHIVVNQNKTLAAPLIDSFIQSGFEDIFVEPEEGLTLINDKTLLFVLDTHNAEFLENIEVYNKCNLVVLIDHHRMMVNHISNSLVFYHEPHASSTAEMATELIQYMGENVLTRLEADALLAGITLDTKNFVLKTGVRTFEAAAYLKQRGADSVEVKRMFTNSIESYKAKYQLVSSAETYNSCAIATTENLPSEVRVTAAQAADELLSLQGVKASFVMYSADDYVNISARSLGDINVQILMEKFDGGGHQTMAGAQITGVSIQEVHAKLIKLISEIKI